MQEGQTLVFIALIHETTIDAIGAENGLPNADSIFVGQELRIPYGLARTPVP